jgi:isopentenyl phosphate kinase
MDNAGAERVVIKLGGGLLTEKSNLCTAKHEVIADIAAAIAELDRRGISVIIVHGAGSFGHLKAKAWQLHLGRNDDVNGGMELMSQDDAISSVHRDMDELNEILVSELSRHGVSTTTHPPREWAVGTGIGFKGDVSRFAITKGGQIPITFGDVVTCEGPNDFGILSGDDLVYRIGTEVPGVSRIIFAIGDADGIMSDIPGKDSSQLLKSWRPGEELIGEHYSRIDVTGGIFLKAKRASQAAANGIEVTIIRGVGDRIVAAGSGEECVGTKISA